MGCCGPDSVLKQFERRRKTRSRFGNVEWHVSFCTTAKARVALLFIESEDYILNDFRFLGCLSRSNNPLHTTIHCNDSINAEFKTTQSPRRPNEASLLFENVLITFVIFSQWIFCEQSDSPTRSDLHEYICWYPYELF